MRDGNLEEFFKHENQSAQPSLASMGKLRLGQESDLLPCFEQNRILSPPDVKVLDGAALVNMLPPRQCKTFDEYARTVFLLYIIPQTQKVERLDIVWDCYNPTSLKQSTRERHANGARLRVTAKATVPGNWQSFLHSDDNS